MQKTGNTILKLIHTLLINAIIMINFVCQTDMMDYKRIYERLEQKYPVIASEVNPSPVIQSTNDLPRYIRQYCRISGVSITDILNNVAESRTMFLAVIIQFIDPCYFEYGNRCNYGMVQAIMSATGASAMQVKHGLTKARNYMVIYPEFREQVSDLHSALLEYETISN